MFKRVGALTSIPLVLGLVASLTLAGSVTAAPSKSADIDPTSSCHFMVTYTWSGMGHGNDLRAIVHVSGWEGSNSSGLASFYVDNVSGRGGQVSHEFSVSGAQAYDHLSGYGELSIQSKSQVLAKSVALSVHITHPGC